MNGIAPEVSNAGEADGNWRNDSSSTHSSSLQFSPSSTDGRPVVSSSVSDWKPTKQASSAIVWKPPVAASMEVKSSTALNPPSTMDGNRTISFVGKKNSLVSSADSSSAPSISSEWKPVQVVTSSTLRVNPPDAFADTPSAGWKKFQVSDSKAVNNNSSDGFTKSAGLNTKAQPIDTTIFDKELTEV